MKTSKLVRVVLLAALALLLGQAKPASAQNFPPPYPQGPQTLATFDCLPGPGYMRINVVGIYNAWSSLQWMGSYAACVEQAQILNRLYGRIFQPELIGVCSGEVNISYLKRWWVDQFGYIGVVTTGLYFGPRPACLDALYPDLGGGDGDGGGTGGDADGE